MSRRPLDAGLARARRLASIGVWIVGSKDSSKRELLALVERNRRPILMLLTLFPLGAFWSREKKGGERDQNAPGVGSISSIRIYLDLSISYRAPK